MEGGLVTNDWIIGALIVVLCVEFGEDEAISKSANCYVT